MDRKQIGASIAGAGLVVASLIGAFVATTGGSEVSVVQPGAALDVPGVDVVVASAADPDTDEYEYEDDDHDEYEDDDHDEYEDDEHDEYEDDEHDEYEDDDHDAYEDDDDD